MTLPPARPVGAGAALGRPRGCVSCATVPPPFAPLRTRTGLAVVVLGLHGLGLLLALRLGAWADRSPAPPPAPVLVWLAPPPAVADRPTAAPAAPRPARQLRERETVRRPAEPQAITLPPAPAPTQAMDVTVPAEAEAPPAAAPPAPLNLALPRGASAPWRQRHPALDDARVLTPGATLEGRIAAALGGSDRITQERLDDGRIRFRRGSECVVAHPNRAERIDPFNASVSPKARPMEKC